MEEGFFEGQWERKQKLTIYKQKLKSLTILKGFIILKGRIILKGLIFLKGLILFKYLIIIKGQEERDPAAQHRDAG